MLTENKTMVTSSESENVLMKDNAVRSKLVNNDFLTKKLDLSSLKVAEIMVTRTASQSLDVTKKIVFISGKRSMAIFGQN